jgi:CheY-like chemotaxis protein
MRPKSSAPTALNILLAEDDPNDIRLLNFALARDGNNGIPARFALARDGEEVLEYLQGEKGFVDREQFPFPDLLILDLNMPKMDGLEVLRWLKRNAACARLPVVMLSGSGLQKDVEEAYELGVNSYFQKPNSVFALTSLLKTLTMYWQLTERPALRELCQ